MNSIIGFTLVFCIVLLAGYAIGRRQGIQAGRKFGQTESKLRLREESLRQGKCKICERSYE